MPASHCLLCHFRISDSLLCPACRLDLPWLDAACSHCARPLPLPGTCPACQHRPPHFHTRAVFRYEYPLPLLIQRFKFHGQAGLARELGEILALSCRDLPRMADNCCIIPMPLHWQRQLWRGFNQALELARPLARALGMPLRPDLCRRRQATRPQSDLRGRARRDNVRKAFEISVRARLPEQVIVVDDVLTSGHTAAALARELRQAGVRDIYVLALARAGIKDW